MPVYEYRCTVCNNVFEVHHHVGGTPGPCPVCGGAPRRIFTSVGVIFKGSGFHTTDYRKPASGDGAAGKESAASKESSTAGTESSGTGGKESTGDGGKSQEAAPKGT